MQEVTLAQVLDAKEARVEEQKSLLNKYKTPLVCFTMNIAGPIKTSPSIERAFFEGLNALLKKIPSQKIIYSQTRLLSVGPIAMLCIKMDAEKIKDICIEIEENCPLGRLFDMDVLDVCGNKLSRKGLRGCIVCGASGRECAAGRLHSVEQIWEKTNKIIDEHFLKKDAAEISKIATESLLDEAYTTPKPGLVDKRNNGSHLDMSLDTFIKSANALTPYFNTCVRTGHNTAKQSPQKTFEELRKAGLLAEKEMYLATNNVNTHKGAIYSFGVICGALGRLWRAESPVAKIEEILTLCAEMTKTAVENDFSKIDNSTAGGRLYLAYGILGIRGEASSGFASIKDISLPTFEGWLNKDLSFNDAGVATLICLIANINDTNLFNRGGCEGAQYAKQAAECLLDKAEFPKTELIEQLDDDFILKNLSPGGCADLLAITYFLHKLKKYKI